MNRPVELSGVIITKNEERNLSRCLRSLDKVCDEILVIDSGSIDRTREIAESFSSVRFITADWRGYSKTKNFGNSQAKGIYILSMDADEELSPELQAEIIKLKQNKFENCAYSINRMTNYCGKWIHHSGWMPDYQLRLFPRAGSQWVGDHVHETMEVPLSIKKKKLEGLAYHYSYYSIEEHVARINRYSSLGAEKNLARKSRSNLFLSMIFNPPLRFLRSYILKRGFLDGFEGFVIACLTATAVFLKYAKALSKK